MTKTCGNCGHSALDDHAQFCNRCGAAVPEDKKQAFPVCPVCGAVVSDELAQFCNRCGSKIPPAPVVCSTCGNPAVDSESRFCTRCGTTFTQKPSPGNRACPACGAPDPTGHSDFCNRCGSSFSSHSIPVINRPAQAPAVVMQRKPVPAGPPAAHPAAVPVVVPDMDWEPWNDVPAPGTAQAQPPAIREEPAHRDQQIPVNQKKYSHLPLVADELKKPVGGPDPRNVPDIHDISPKKRAGAQKKGVLGFLKK